LPGKKGDYHLQKIGEKFLNHFNKERSLQYVYHPLHVQSTHLNLLNIKERGKGRNDPLDEYLELEQYDLLVRH